MPWLALLVDWVACSQLHSPENLLPFLPWTTLGSFPGHTILSLMQLLVLELRNFFLCESHLLPNLSSLRIWTANLPGLPLRSAIGKWYLGLGIGLSWHSTILAHILMHQAADWCSIDTEILITTYCKHIFDCPFSSPPWDISSNSASSFSIAFWVTAFNLVPSSRIWKRQKFFAISCGRLPRVWNLLNSKSRVCTSIASSFIRKSFSVAGRCLEVVYTYPKDLLWLEHICSELWWNFSEYHLARPMDCLSLEVIPWNIQRERIWRILHASLIRIEQWLRLVDSQTSSSWLLHFHLPKDPVPYIEVCSIKLPTGPRFSPILNDILKLYGLMSHIDLKPYSSVVITLIEGILVPVIIKTIHCMHLVCVSSPLTWKAFAVLKDLSCWWAISSRECSQLQGSIVAL